MGWQRSTTAARKFVAGQAARLRDDVTRASELLRRGELSDVAELLERNREYANAIWHELDLLTRPPREPVIRGKSSRR